MLFSYCVQPFLTVSVCLSVVKLKEYAEKFPNKNDPIVKGFLQISSTLAPSLRLLFQDILNYDVKTDFSKYIDDNAADAIVLEPTRSSADSSAENAFVDVFFKPSHRSEIVATKVIIRAPKRWVHAFSSFRFCRFRKCVQLAQCVPSLPQQPCFADSWNSFVVVDICP